MIEQTGEISKVSVKEVELLRTLSILTFTETFAESNTESDMQKYIAEKLNTLQLSKELQTENSYFYFLKLHEEVIGYLKLNTGIAQTEQQGNDCIEIERIYVKQQYHGQSFGKFLMQKAIDIAKEMHYSYIWLAVWEHNIKAINFYKKQGFIEFDKHTFQLGYDVQLDLMMKMNLN